MSAIDLDDDFIRIETAINDFDQHGDAPLRKGESPFQWSLIEAESLALLDRASDPRIAGWYCRASIATRGIEGVADGINALVTALEASPIFVANASETVEFDDDLLALHLGWLATPRFAHNLRRAVVDQSISATTLADLANASVAPSTLGVSGEVGAAVRQALVRARDAFIRLSARLGKPLTELLQLDVHRSLLEDAIAALGASVADRLDELLPSVARAAVESSEGLRSRDEAAVLLDRLLAYFEEREPGHPATIFLVRVQRMLGANFETLMKELYADADVLIARIDRPHAP